MFKEEKSKFMPKKYTTEQFWELYKKLPQELKDALFAEEAGNNVFDICKKNGVEENLDQIIDYVSQVLLGLLPPEDFQKILEKDLKIEKDTAKEVNREINRFVFYPVKPVLDQFYKKEESPAAEEIQKTVLEEKKEEEKKITKQDSYREPIE